MEKFCLRVGDAILLQFAVKVVEGTVYAIYPKKIDLINVCDVKNEQMLTDGVMTFYLNEIQEIVIYGSEIDSQENGNTAEVSRRCLLIKHQDFFKLRAMINNCLYIYNVDSRFVDAMHYLESCETVGVACLGGQRDYPCSMLALASRDRVFLLYFRDVQKITKQLKDILENDQIVKVIHNAEDAYHCMKNFYRVKMRNIFDTRIGSSSVLNVADNKCKNVGKVLSKCLNMPPMILKDATSLTEAQWRDVVISPQRQKQAASLVAYLITLKDHMERQMLSDYYEALNKSLCDE